MRRWPEWSTNELALVPTNLCWQNSLRKRKHNVMTSHSRWSANRQIASTKPASRAFPAMCDTACRRLLTMKMLRKFRWEANHGPHGPHGQQLQVFQRISRCVSKAIKKHRKHPQAILFFLFRAAHLQTGLESVEFAEKAATLRLGVRLDFHQLAYSEVPKAGRLPHWTPLWWQRWYPINEAPDEYSITPCI